MKSVTEMDLPTFEYGKSFLAPDIFHEHLAGARGQGWLARSHASRHVVLVLDREAGEFFLRCKAARFPGREFADAAGITTGPARELIDGHLLNHDDDHHRRLRVVARQALGPRMVDKWRPAMRASLARLWSTIEPATKCDFVAVARPYPSLTMAAILGAPAADASRLDIWARRANQQFDVRFLAQEATGIERASVEVHEYARALFERQQGEPSDSLVGLVLAAEARGDLLSRSESVDLVVNMITAGITATQTALVHALRLFAEHPDQWALLAQRPEMIEQAVSEVLRFEPPSPFTPRICVEEIEYRGVLFPKGTIVAVCLERANREPPARRPTMDEHADIECFDISASRDGRILTFGVGPHHCPGGHIARAQLEEALTFLAPRMQGLVLDGVPEVPGSTALYEIGALPLRWDAGQDPSSLSRKSNTASGVAD